MDAFAFVSDDLSIKGFANPVNYIAKYISKSLDLKNIEEYRKYRKVSELPERLRTGVWTILNNLIWNSHTWVISKKFKDELDKLKERREKNKGLWMWVNTVSKDDSHLRMWICLGPDDEISESQFRSCLVMPSLPIPEAT